jgi:PKD repeat protein
MKREQTRGVTVFKAACVLFCLTLVMHSSAFGNGSFLQSSEASGIVAIEAEHFHENVTLSGKTWIANSSSGYSGTGAMVTSPNTGLNINTGYASTSPRMDYQVTFVRTGKHYIWTRGIGPSGNDDSYHIGLDGVAISSCDRISGFDQNWTWTRNTLDGVVASFTVANTGVHTVNVWMREDGFIIDKMVITTDDNYTPSGSGPAESPLTGVNNAPSAVFTVSTTSGTVPLAVSFNAGNSTDPDGNALTFSWNFGDGATGSGVTASHTFTVAGVYPVTLIVADGNGGADTAVTSINATIDGNSSFLQSSAAAGLLSIEAEHYHVKVDKSGKSWVANSSSGYSGDGAMVTTPNTGLNIDVDYADNSPRMDYQVNFVHTGIHYIWTRGLGSSGANNSFHAGLDGTEY